MKRRRLLAAIGTAIGGGALFARYSVLASPDTPGPVTDARIESEQSGRNPGTDPEIEIERAGKRIQVLDDVSVGTPKTRAVLETATFDRTSDEITAVVTGRARWHHRLVSFLFGSSSALNGITYRLTVVFDRVPSAVVVEEESFDGDTITIEP